MPRIAIGNMLIGFIFVFMSASAGFFLSTEHTRAHIEGGQMLNSWWLQLSSSAHGHTNLFGILHVILGLTIPYSFQGKGIRVCQTIGLFMGGFAMSFLMFLRAQGSPSLEYDAIGILIGVCLSAALVSIGIQIAGLSVKFFK